MKDLTKKKHIYPISIYNQLLDTKKQIFMCLLIIFIFVFLYYICMYTYDFGNSNDNYQLTIVCTTSIEELKPANQSNI